MAQSLILDAKGLYTYSSPISGVPLGSLSVAMNVNINRTGIIEPRKGFDYLTYALPLTTDRTKKLMFWNNELFIHYGSSFSYYNPASGLSSRGSLASPSDSVGVFTVNSQNKNLYVTSSAGLKKTDAIGNSLISGGVPKGLNMDLTLAGAGTALLNTYTAGYRYILGRKDANSNIQYGGVSGRFAINNAAGSTQNVTVKCFLPSGLDTSNFIQLYKINEATATLTDELQLCYETPITATHITDGYVTITDIVPDDLLGATIYTASSQQGLVNDNAIPPLSRDIAEYKTHMFYADTESPQRLTFSLISAGGTGLVSGDTVTVTLAGSTPEVYTAGSTFNHTTKTFVVSTGSSYPAINIDATAKSLIKCINLASSLVSAYSMSTDSTSLPGKMLCEARTLGSAAFTVVSTRPAAFQPQLPNPATINNTSIADISKNQIMYSKPNQQEAVPLKNVFKVGSSDDRVKRIVALRDGLFILKEKDGVFVLRGDNEANFQVTPLDNTAKLVAPNSVVTVNNLIYGLFEAGICEVSDTGVSIISDPIKDQILPLFGAPLSTVKQYAFGIGNDVDGKYILSVPTLSTDVYNNRQIVFDTFGRTFTNWDMPLSCGGINPADSKMYFGKGTNNHVIKERKQTDYTDYADYEATCAVSSYTGTTVYINNISGMAKGDIIYQGTTGLAYIESVSASTGSVEIDTPQTWTIGTSDVIHVKAIDCKIQWNPDVGGNAGALKHYYECSLISKSNFQKEATMYFVSDINPSESSIVIYSSSGNGAFGQFLFGDEVFGGAQSSSPKRVGIPRGHSRCSLLTIRFENKVAFSDFEVTGLSLSFNTSSTRTTR